MDLSLQHGVTWTYEEVVAHMQGGEGLAFKVSNPNKELVVTSNYEAALLTIKGTTDRKLGVVAITMRRDVWGIYSVAYKRA